MFEKYAETFVELFFDMKRSPCSHDDHLHHGCFFFLVAGGELFADSSLLFGQIELIEEEKELC